jgi:hypothetical protein
MSGITRKGKRRAARGEWTIFTNMAEGVTAMGAAGETPLFPSIDSFCREPQFASVARSIFPERFQPKPHTSESDS